MVNNHDAFSHSEQCDQFFSGPAVTHPGTGCLVSGFEQKHEKCRCWCHNAEYLFSSPEPEYDFSPPPEYLSSADRAFFTDEPAHVRVGFSYTGDLAFSNSAFSNSAFGDSVATDRGAVVLDSRLNEIEARPTGSVDIHEGPANKAGFSKWSRGELASGKCDICSDKLADCECVE